MSQTPISGSGQGPGQPSTQIFNQQPILSYNTPNPFLNPQFGRPYRALWELIVLHSNVRSAQGVICSQCQALIIDLAAGEFSKRGCPLPPGVNRSFIDNVGSSNTVTDYKCRAVVNIIRQQGTVWRHSKPNQFQHVLHTQWVAGMPEEFAAKLAFACQHSYSLADLHKERPFANAGPTSYMGIFKRYIAAVANPCLGEKCTCRGSNWYSKSHIMDYAGKFEKETALLMTDGPDDFLVELEMSCHIKYHLARGIRHVLESNTAKDLQFNDFMSRIWNEPVVRQQLQPLANSGGREWVERCKSCRLKLKEMYETFAVAVSNSPYRKGF